MTQIFVMRKYFLQIFAFALTWQDNEAFKCKKVWKLIIRLDHLKKQKYFVIRFLLLAAPLTSWYQNYFYFLLNQFLSLRTFALGI